MCSFLYEEQEEEGEIIFNVTNIHLIHANLVSPEYNILLINVLNQEAYSNCGAQRELNN